METLRNDTSSLHHANLITKVNGDYPITAQVTPPDTHLPALGTASIASTIQTPQAGGTERVTTGGQQQWPVVLCIVRIKAHLAGQLWQGRKTMNFLYILICARKINN